MIVRTYQSKKILIFQFWGGKWI